MFQKNAYVFYGSGGICLVCDVLSSPLEGMPADRLYYVLKSVHDSNGVMYVPVDNDRVFLRALITAGEAEDLLAEIAEIPCLSFEDSKQLRAAYAAAMDEHVPRAWVSVIKTMRMRLCEDKGRRLSETERGMAESARRFLTTELSLSLGCTEAEAEARLSAVL